MQTTAMTEEQASSLVRQLARQTHRWFVLRQQTDGFVTAPLDAAEYWYLLAAEGLRPLSVGGRVIDGSTRVFSPEGHAYDGG